MGRAHPLIARAQELAAGLRENRRARLSEELYPLTLTPPFYTLMTARTAAAGEGPARRSGRSDT